jgi:hypothetical protein
MKYLNIFAAFLIFALCQNVFAQEPDPLSFFPHAVGNVWEYDTPNGIQKFEILADSIDPNHNIFIYLNRYPSYKIDTNYFVYSDPDGLNWKYYNLAADSADYWLVDSITYWFARVSNIYSTTLFGKERIIKEIEYGVSLGSVYDPNYFWAYTIETLAEGIGLIYKWNEEDPQGPQRILLGCVIDDDTLGTLTSVEDELHTPIEFLLYQNFPNPFNPNTTIRFQIAHYSLVELKIFDLLGREITTLLKEEKPAGIYEVNFNGSSHSSGTYIYRLKTDNKIISKKMILLK